MTVTFVGAGTSATGNNASVTPAKHASTAVGDTVLIFASIRGSGTGTVNTPTGWTVVKTSGNATLLGKYWATGDVIPTITFTGGAAGDDTIAECATWRGLAIDALVTAVTADQLNGSAQNVAYPGLTVPADNMLLLLLGWKQDDFSSVTTPAGWTSAGTQSTTTGNDASQAWYYQIQTTKTNITTGSVTWTGGASAISRGIVVALKPPPAIAVTEQDVYPPRVVVSVTGIIPGDSVALYRIVGGNRTALRGASTDAATDPSFVRTDAELPFGVPVTYVAVVEAVEYTTGATTYTLPGGKAVLSDAISGLAQEIVIVDEPERDWDLGASVLRAGGRNIVNTDGMGQFTTSIDIYLEATSSSDQLESLVRTATQGILQLRQPGGYDGVDAYLAVTSVRKKRVGSRGTDARRIWTLAAAEVEPWDDSQEDLGFTLADIADFYGTTGTLTDISDDGYGTLLGISLGDFS